MVETKSLQFVNFFSTLYIFILSRFCLQCKIDSAINVPISLVNKIGNFSRRTPPKYRLTMDEKFSLPFGLGQMLAGMEEKKDTRTKNYLRLASKKRTLRTVTLLLKRQFRRPGCGVVRRPPPSPVHAEKKWWTACAVSFVKGPEPLRLRNR